MKKMKLTVIVTVFNIAEHLPRFFEAMKNQTYSDYVLLVLDDGSQDNSLKVCREYEKQDSRIKVIPCEHLGIAGIKNRAMEYIDTEFTAYVDGDDYVDPGYLEHLMTAREKYDADLVVSRVQYHLEDGHIEGSFKERGEMYIPREEFKEKLPMLLDERRLNYVYGKVYRSSLLTKIRVEDDVRQGMDTMINFMYLSYAGSIVLIDDLDYHYIRYKSRSITSYSGDNAYFRLLRINCFVQDKAAQYGYLTDELQKVIDKRILQTAFWVIDKIMKSDATQEKKAEQITTILSNEYYWGSYERQKERSAEFGFEIIRPLDGAEYIKRRKKQSQSEQTKEKLLRVCPKPLLRLYRKAKGARDDE